MADMISIDADHGSDLWPVSFEDMVGQLRLQGTHYEEALTETTVTVQTWGEDRRSLGIVMADGTTFYLTAPPTPRHLKES